MVGVAIAVPGPGEIVLPVAAAFPDSQVEPWEVIPAAVAGGDTGEHRLTGIEMVVGRFEILHPRAGRHERAVCVERAAAVQGRADAV